MAPPASPLISRPPNEDAASAALFAQHLIRISDLMNKKVASMFRESEGLKTVEVRILINLSDGEPASIADVSRRTGLDKAWISRTARTLEERGLLEIGSGARPAAKLLTLTGAGKEARARIAPLLSDEWVAATHGINTRLGAQMLQIVFDNLRVRDPG